MKHEVTLIADTGYVYFGLLRRLVLIGTNTRSFVTLAASSSYISFFVLSVRVGLFYIILSHFFAACF